MECLHGHYLDAMSRSFGKLWLLILTCERIRMGSQVAAAAVFAIMLLRRLDGGELVMAVRMKDGTDGRLTSILT